jgi:hypothetical protein
MAVKYVKDFEFTSKGPKLVRGYMRGGSCSGYAHGGAVAGDKVSTGKTPGKGPEHTLGFAKGGKVAKAAPKGLSVMIAVGTKKAPPAAKKGASPVPGVALGMKKGGMANVEKVMGEYGKGELHSGSKTGPVVKNPKQAVAIALSEARKAGAKIPVKKQAGGLMAKAMPEDERAAGLMRKVAGMAMTDAEAKRAAGRSMSYLSPKGKAALAKAPTRAQYDAMIAAQTAAPVITPAQRRAMNNETMIGRKKGGMVKC